MKGGDEVAEKDIAEKTLEGYNDVFADIANVLLFNIVQRNCTAFLAVLCQIQHQPQCIASSC